MKLIRFACVALISFVLSSCGGGSSSSPGSANPITSLYIADTNNGRVVAYDSPTTADGTIAPDRAIAGLSTQITANSNDSVGYDPRTDSLFVTDNNALAILIFDNVSSTTGNTAPSRVLTGASTGFSSPEGVALDTTRDLLYVTDAGRVLVFSGAKTIDGNVAPLHTISSTTLSGHGDIRPMLDQANNRLYVADGNGAAIDVYDKASTVDGNVAPDRAIAGASTTLAFPWGLDLDTQRNLLYVADQGAGVLVFANASTATGNIPPTRTINGPTSTIQGLSDTYIDSATDTLYALDANGNTVLVWDKASTKNGDIAPSRSIDGSFNYPSGFIGAK